MTERVSSPAVVGHAPIVGRGVDLTGRVGLFIGGYFALGVVTAVYGGVRGSVGDVAFVHALVGAAFATALLWTAEHLRGGELDPLAVMAAFGSTAFVVVATRDLGLAVGADGRSLFWFVVLVALPVAVATVLWMPHPILGASVAVGACLLVLAAPLGDHGTSVAAGKALLLALLLAGFAVLVDLRTRSRAGSLLHYSAIVALAIAEVILGYDLDAPVAGLVLAALGGAELVISLLLRRRSWAISGWLTLAIAILTATGASLVDAFGGGAVAAVVAVPLVAAAFVVQREGDRARGVLLEALPPHIAESFPA